MVDDEPNILSAYRRSLGRVFSITTCESGRAGLEALDKADGFPVVITDMRMPEMDGVQFVQNARKKHPDCVYVMLTGNADQQTAIDAINKGQVYRFLNKPCPTEVLEHTIKASLRQYELIHAEKTLLRDTLTGSVRLLIEAMSMTDPAIGAATEQIRQDVRAISEKLRGDVDWRLSLASSLVLFGSVTVPSNEGKAELSDEFLERVAEVGCRLLSNIPRLRPVGEIIAAHRRFGELGSVEGEMDENRVIDFGGQILRFVVDWRRAAIKADDDRFAALDELKSAIPPYDARLLDAASTLVAGTHRNPKLVAKDLTLSIRELLSGDLTREDIITADELLLVKSGQELSPLLLERLRGFERAGLLKSPSVDVTRFMPAEEERDAA